MKQQKETVNLTVAQAIIKYLSSQYIEIDGEKVRLCGGGFGIFGHGNVTCLGEALYENKDKLPLYRGQNEQGMGFAAAAYAKAHLRRRFMFCTASAGPGTTNLLTSAALAHANRLPMLMLCGDTFITRLPDPVLQQLEHFGNPTLGVNDAFKSVSSFLGSNYPSCSGSSIFACCFRTPCWTPAIVARLFLALPQDVQGWTYDYPSAFFDESVHRIRRQAADVSEIARCNCITQKCKAPNDYRGRWCAVFWRSCRTDGIC